MVSKLEALRKLSYAKTGQHHQEEFEKQLEPGTSDRGACLLMVAHLERELTAALESKLPNLDNSQRAAMFEQDGPLATFSRKITMAHALGIIGPKAFANFKIIRFTRNAFAHATVPITFDTTEIEQACGELHLIDPLAPYGDHVINTYESTRALFAGVCASMMVMLYSYAGNTFNIDKHESKDGVVPQSPLP
ncbi:hypothetical protein [Bradyrhizobium sp. LA6.1]|uniref:hypothetical protein n=1 Tax=Bradyrhizobium sp. LA6.1 TaxID=3156378 RepID=UPI0033969D76